MPLPVEKVGKSYEPVSYAIGREKIREYAAAVGESDPLHHSVAAARAAGYADVVAPPMFAVVYAGRAVIPALFDPELRIDFAHLVHGAQAFTWERLLVAGEEVATTATVTRIESRGGLGFYEFQSRTLDSGGATVCVGEWTNIVRGVEG
jgi:acyl dehydratase